MKHANHGDGIVTDAIDHHQTGFGHTAIIDIVVGLVASGERKEDGVPHGCFDPSGDGDGWLRAVLLRVIQNIVQVRERFAIH